MSYQALARRWRPRDFGTIVGQEHVVRALVNAFERERLHHAYLFSGTRGVGKTTIARVFARGLNCDQGPTARPCGECGACREIDEGRHVDLIEVDAASRARVEETRDLLDNVQYAPVRARFKVYLIDEVHMFSRHSFNALLKTLEEPPPHVKFLLATTDPQRLPITIVSRCLQFGLRRLGVDEIAGELARIAKEEGLEAEPAALRLLGRAADGSMRDALSLLDQAAAYGAGTILAADLRTLLGSVGRERLAALFEALVSSDAPAMIEALDRLAEEAADFEAVLAEIIESLGRMAALKVMPDRRDGDEDLDALRGFAERCSPEAIQLYYQIGLMGRRDLPHAPHPRGAFEMTMLRMVAFAPEPGGAGGGGTRPDRGESPRTGSPPPASVPPSNPTPAPPVAPAPPPVLETAPAPRVRERASREADPGPFPPPRAPAPGGPGGLSPAGWPEIARQLDLSGMARLLASNCVLRRHSEGTIDLDLGREHEQLLNAGTRGRLEAALGDYLGRSIRLRVEVTAHRGETPAERAAREEGDRIERATRELEADPVYRDLLERFEASPRSIQPPD